MVRKSVGSILEIPIKLGSLWFVSAKKSCLGEFLLRMPCCHGCVYRIHESLDLNVFNPVSFMTRKSVSPAVFWLGRLEL